MTEKEKICKFLEYKGVTKNKFYTVTGLSNGFLDSGKSLGVDKLKIILDNYPDLNLKWLISGEGEMIQSGVQEKSGNLIPFFEDVYSIGGMNSISASVDGTMPSSEFIDAGDWFKDATAAIRHYGDSMVEYPSGCIIVLKEIRDIRHVVWGRNYCIETLEYRITKKLQRGKNSEYYTAYSTNLDTYPDGHLIHEPVDIPAGEIRRLFLVIGCVIKEQSSGPIYISEKR